jgi:hypothetical protein
MLNLANNIDQPELTGIRTRIYELSGISNYLPLRINVMHHVQDQIEFILQGWSKKTKDNELETTFTDYVTHFRKWCGKNPSMCKYLTKPEISKISENLEKEKSKEQENVVPTKQETKRPEGCGVEALEEMFKMLQSNKKEYVLKSQKKTRGQKMDNRRFN